MNKEPQVVILGAGISGLLAAWALERLNIPFMILDKGPREALPRIVPGCVYLHDPCYLPHTALHKATMWTQVLPPGPLREYPPASYAEMYHRKLWGSRPFATNSVSALPVDPTGLVGVFKQVYSMNAALYWLYHHFSSRITIRDVQKDHVTLALANTKVISTIPMQALGMTPTEPYISKDTWIAQMPETQRRPDGLPASIGLTATTLYNIDPSISWYRASSMFGFFAVEFMSDPGGASAKFKKIMSGPSAEKIEAMNPNLMLTGRWGRWQRGFLSHQTYHDVMRRFG